MADSDFSNPTPQLALRNTRQNPAPTCASLVTRVYLVSISCQRLTRVRALRGSTEKPNPKGYACSFVRGLVFGFGGAILGLILYSGFSIITGIAIGYVSLAVGWIIAKAIKVGSCGIGGRRYQVAAAALTYAAVSMAAIPIYVSQAIKQEPKTKRKRGPLPPPILIRLLQVRVVHRPPAMILQSRLRRGSRE